MKISRRQFIILSSLGLAGASLTKLLSQRTSAQSSRLLPNNTFIQPAELRNSSRQRGLAEFSLQTSVKKVMLPGTGVASAELITYNSSFPGPTLRVKEGERVRIHLQNNLDKPTNFHLHGMHVSPEGNGDNVFRTISSGENALVEFSVPEGSAGTYWYHPHYHGNSNLQLFAGLSGTIIVEPLHPLPELHNVPDYLVVLKDLDVDATGKIPPITQQDWMNGREGSLVLVNGVMQPTLQTEAGLVRLRLINQSTARYYNLMLENHPMTVIATDGNFVSTPYQVDSLLLAPAERYEVLVKFKQTGEFRLINMPYPRGRGGIDIPMADKMSSGSGMGDMGSASGKMSSGSGMGDMGSSNGMSGMDSMKTQATGEGPLMTLRFRGRPYMENLPHWSKSVKVLSPGDAVVKRTINFTEDMGMLSFSFNNQKFDPNRMDITSKLGTVELWEVINNTDMDHPFHVHVNPFQVYARNGQPETQVIWKDTVNVKSKETVQILIPFEDFTGKTVFHCHILEHEELGMMGVLEIVS